MHRVFVLKSKIITIILLLYFLIGTAFSYQASRIYTHMNSNDDEIVPQLHLLADSAIHGSSMQGL